jgi:recombinational DNA repair protein (RecF pathway)
LEQFINLLGHNLAVNYCIKCHNRKLKTVSFKDHGMLCNLCFDPQKDKYYELDVSKTIHYLFNREYDELNKYYQCFDFVIKLLHLYIDDNSGIKLQSLQNY